MSRILLLFSHATHDGWRAREGVDAGLAALAFEHELSLLFVGAGVCLLRPGAQGTEGLRDWAPALRGLAVHGAERIGADAEALTAHGLHGAPLRLHALTLDAAQRRDWIRSADVVLAF
jgi:tRNA 2-thiouridine synthesizing protein C